MRKLHADFGNCNIFRFVFAYLFVSGYLSSFERRSPKVCLCLGGLWRFSTMTRSGGGRPMPRRARRLASLATLNFDFFLRLGIEATIAEFAGRYVAPRNRQKAGRFMAKAISAPFANIAQNVARGNPKQNRPPVRYEQPVKSISCGVTVAAGTASNGLPFASVPVDFEDGLQSTMPPLMGTKALTLMV